MAKSRRTALLKNRRLIFLLFTALGVYLIWPGPTSFQKLNLITITAPSTSENYSPSVLFISFHEGTAVDFNAIAKKINFTHYWSLPKSQYLPMIIQDPYLVSEEHANLLWEKFEDSNCKNYDVIVVADTITAGGRPFIQGLLNVLKEARSRDNNNRNIPARDVLKSLGYKAKVVFLMTQRFDYYHFNDTAYHRDFEQAAKEGVIQLIANNPYEEWYMKIRAGIVFGENRDQDRDDKSDDSDSSVTSGSKFVPSIPIVRPHGRGWVHWHSQDGYTRIVSKLTAHQARKKDEKYSLPAVINTRDHQKNLIEFLDFAQIKYTVLQSRKYGGPQGLALFPCLIHSPYQVSTMSLYENLAAGVVIFVPSLEILKLFGSFSHELFLPDDFSLEKINWDLVEWYSPYFDEVIIKFYSAKHLKELLETTDFEAASDRAVKFMEENEKKVMKQWKEIIFS
jgi:hypothetical protein